jgi:radical SAM protein with 4Fe4S-binding SPASM domain
LRRLAESGITGVRLAFTATPRNVDHFERVYDLARQLGVEFTCALAQASDHYFQISDLGPAIPREDLLRHVAPVARAELASASPKRWARAYFMNGLLRFAAGKGRPLRCRAGRDFFFADPSGDVYPCNVLSPVMGNLAEQGFEEMWRSERVRRCRSQADACQGGCWMVCSARTAMRRRWPLVLAWALWHKVRPGQLG